MKYIDITDILYMAPGTLQVFYTSYEDDCSEGVVDHLDYASRSLKDALRSAKMDLECDGEVEVNIALPSKQLSRIGEE